MDSFWTISSLIITSLAFLSCVITRLHLLTRLSIVVMNQQEVTLLYTKAECIATIILVHILAFSTLYVSAIVYVGGSFQLTYWLMLALLPALFISWTIIGELKFFSFKK